MCYYFVSDFVSFVILLCLVKIMIGLMLKRLAPAPRPSVLYLFSCSFRVAPLVYIRSCRSFWHWFILLWLLLTFVSYLSPLGIDGPTGRLICVWLLFVLCLSFLVGPAVPSLFTLFYFCCMCFVKRLETSVTGALKELFYYYYYYYIEWTISDH